MTDNPTILVVEDEADLRAGISHNLEVEGFNVVTAANGREGLDQVQTHTPNLILLDLMMPVMGGLEMLDALRDDGQVIPVIVLTAKGQDQDIVEGLERGADDYVTKPFGLTELIARIRAVLRRSQPQGSERAPVLRFPNLTLDFRRFTATRDDVEHQLSRYEAEILKMLVDRRGEVVSRKDLLTEVWGYTHLPTTRTVDNHIARLRKKIEHDAESPIHVVTVHGLGYRFDSLEQT